ncbi:MAG: tRNA (guanosine(46)-N7)-methyltransferase TrmB [Magnetococcales bacterium]|nr:tRNA (guanosine(46)-N7)-methyltransferase TrmB [Magnetococcales bacterium]
MNQQPPDPDQDRRRFKTYGRKQGHLTGSELQRLEMLLPRYRLEASSGQDRDGFLQQWDPGALTGPLWVEIGFGNGDCLAHLAERHPEDAMIGIDVFLEGIAALVHKLERSGQRNVRLARGHAHPVLRDLLPDGTIDRVIINFPDPWPKKRHHKRRLIQTEFLDLLARKMRPGGCVTLATDWQEYAEWMETLFAAHPAFDGGASPPPDEWIVTRFQAKGLQAGRATSHLAYFRRSDTNLHSSR